MSMIPNGPLGGDSRGGGLNLAPWGGNSLASVLQREEIVLQRGPDGVASAEWGVRSGNAERGAE